MNLCNHSVLYKLNTLTNKFNWVDYRYYSSVLDVSFLTRWMGRPFKFKKRNLRDKRISLRWEVPAQVLVACVWKFEQLSYKNHTNIHDAGRYLPPINLKFVRLFYNVGLRKWAYVLWQRKNYFFLIGGTLIFLCLNSANYCFDFEYFKLPVLRCTGCQYCFQTEMRNGQYLYPPPPPSPQNCSPSVL